MHEIQIEDLLGRPPVNLDQDNLMKYLSGKSVLITGAGGSIGSELARQVSLFNPSKLLLVEQGCERALRLFLNELLPEGRVLIPALNQHDSAMPEALLSGPDDLQAQRDLPLVASV